MSNVNATSISLTVGPADEGDEPNSADEQKSIGSKSYSSTNARNKRERACLHCKERFTRDRLYKGEYCEDCRPPDGFIDES